MGDTTQGLCFDRKALVLWNRPACLCLDCPFPLQKEQTHSSRLESFLKLEKRNSDIFVQRRRKVRLTRVDGIVGHQTEGVKRVSCWRRGRDVLSSCHFTEWLLLWPQTTFLMDGDCGDMKCSRLLLVFLVCPALECSLWVGLLLTSTATSL